MADSGAVLIVGDPLLFSLLFKRKMYCEQKKSISLLFKREVLLLKKPQRKDILKEIQKSIELVIEFHSLQSFSVM